MKRIVYSLPILLFLCLSVLVSALPIRASEAIHLEEVSFFGDSTTHGLIRYIAENDGHLGKPITHLKRDQILTPPDGTFYLRNLPTAKILYQGESLSLAEAIQIASPKILVVTVGINGLPHWTRENFQEQYDRLLTKISNASPSTRIVLQSVYPTAENRADHLAAFSVEKVNRLNEWIREIAAQHNLLYIDTASKLKGADGWLRPELQNGDGLHLNTAGFNIVLDSIASALKLKG